MLVCRVCSALRIPHVTELELNTVQTNLRTFSNEIKTIIPRESMEYVHTKNTQDHDLSPNYACILTLDVTLFFIARSVRPHNLNMAPLAGETDP